MTVSRMFPIHPACFTVFVKPVQVTPVCGGESSLAQCVCVCVHVLGGEGGGDDMIQPEDDRIRRTNWRL